MSQSRLAQGDQMKVALAGVGLVSGTVSNSVTVNNGLHALISVQWPYYNVSIHK